MILTIVVSLAVLGQLSPPLSPPERTIFQFGLPGGQLNIKQAQEKSRTIVAAEIVALGTIGHGPGPVGDVRLKSSAVLKGDLKDAGLNRVSLSLASPPSGLETFPDPDIEHIFFIGDFQGRPTIVKVCPKTRANIEAINVVVNEALLPGSRLDLDQAWDLAWTIVVAKSNARNLLGSGPHTLANVDLKPSTILKGRLKTSELKDVSLSYVGKETLPDPKKEHVFFLGGTEDRPTIIKVMPKTDEDVEDLKTAMGRAFLPGSRVDLDQAQEKSQVIVVATIGPGIVVGSGPSSFGIAKLKPSATLKGKAEEAGLEKVGLSYSSPESCPVPEREYLVFLYDYSGHPQILKVMQATPENIEAVKEVIRAAEKP